METFMPAEKPFDLIVYGATGYTGRLVADYLVRTYGVDGEVKWAMAARSADKLAAVRDEIGAPQETPFVIADANDASSLKAMAEQARCIVTTVGPYQLYGEALINACSEVGTDYVDLCGEPTWMHQMISKYDAQAKSSGARIVFSCGFDSIPFDLGVWFLQDEAQKKFGKPVSRIKGRVRQMQGTFSGGTAYSMKATMAAIQKDPSLMPIMLNPFSLTMGFQGPEQPTGMQPIEEADIGGWSAPFIMAAINTKNIHRSNALLGHLYGEDFVYDEMMFTGPGDQGKAAADMAMGAMKSLGGDKGPKPGEGPSAEEREAGFYDILFYGKGDGDEVIKVGVTGDKDPGYGSTSKMISEAAICLVKDCKDTKAGFWTPAPAMGGKLVKRMISKAGLTFEVEA